MMAVVACGLDGVPSHGFSRVLEAAPVERRGVMAARARDLPHGCSGALLLDPPPTRTRSPHRWGTGLSARACRVLPLLLAGSRRRWTAASSSRRNRGGGASSPHARDVIPLGVASGIPSWNTGNLLYQGYTGRVSGWKQQRRTSIVSVFGRKSKTIIKETVVPDPDYRLPIAILGIAGAFAYADNLLAAAPVGLLGLLLLFQTTRVRFVFDDEALEVKVGNQLQESGENVFVGGKNRWKYSTFVNWELWWPQFPVLVYFKEAQTKPEGQIHFFPVIFNGKQLYDVMVERAGSSKTSGPK